MSSLREISADTSLPRENLEVWEEALSDISLNPNLESSDNPLQSKLLPFNVQLPQRMIEISLTLQELQSLLTNFLCEFPFGEVHSTDPKKELRRNILIPIGSSWTDPFKGEENYWRHWLQDSTEEQKYSEEIDQKIKSLFEAAKEQIFEDGMESDFSKELVSLVEKYGDAAIAVITRLIVTGQSNAEVASEALRWLGRMEHTLSYQSRLFLLERSLYSNSARIRDGAALGLASLDDPHAIPHLRRAVQREKYPELRYDLEQILVELETAH